MTSNLPQQRDLGVGTFRFLSVDKVRGNGSKELFFDLPCVGRVARSFGEKCPDETVMSVGVEGYQVILPRV